MAQVDIVIPLYNKAQCVARAVRSIQEQTMADWRLIVVDDGSTDDGPDIVHKIDDDRIEIITQTNQGPGAARNAGIARATSEYLAFLDADDEWYPDYLANSLKIIQQEKVGLVATMYEEKPKTQDVTQYWASRNVRPGKFSLKEDDDPAWVDSLGCFIYACNSLMRTEVARKYDGFYDKNHCSFGEDTTFFLRIVFNETFIILGQAGLCRHREDSQLSNKERHRHRNIDLSSIEAYPWLPFFLEPQTVLSYCPAQKRELMLKTLDWTALRTARNLTSNHALAQAAELLRRFPGAKSFRAEYRRYLLYRLKCTVGPPIRSFLMRLQRNQRQEP